MQILNSTLADIDAIFELYDEAVALQKKVFNKHWQGFDRQVIEKEILELRQWKLVLEGQLAGIFAVTFFDPLIWGDKDLGDSMYLHRIVSHPNFRGKNAVQTIVAWGKNYCQEKGLTYLRLDTWGDNPKLYDYYLKAGFTFVGYTEMKKTEGLPKHYEGLQLALFEIKVDED